MNSKEIAEKLEQYPDLRLRFEELLQIIENDNGEILSANVAEQRVIDSLRDLGKDMLQSWGETTSNRVSQQVKQKFPTARKDVKKKSAGTQPMG
jgi:hypothetical protein